MSDRQRHGDGSHRLAGIRPLHIFGAAPVYLALAWLISYLGDAHNFLALTDRLINRGAERPFMWYYLFMEGSPTEMLQWTYLAGTVLICGLLSGRLAADRNVLPARFFLLMGVGTAVMLMEDAGNLRHQIKFYVRLALGDTMALGVAVELIFFALLGIFMLYLLARYGRWVWHQRTTRNYLLFGYAAYAVASLASGTRHFADWYDRAGEQFLRFLGLYDHLNALFIPTSVGRPIGFYVMDFLLEESLELLAAAALCAAVYAYYRAPSAGDRIPD